MAAPGCSQLEGRKNDHRAAATVSTFSAGGSAAAGTNLQRTCVSIFEKNKTKKKTLQNMSHAKPFRTPPWPEGDVEAEEKGLKESVMRGR